MIIWLIIRDPAVKKYKKINPDWGWSTRWNRSSQNLKKFANIPLLMLKFIWRKKKRFQPDSHSMASHWYLAGSINLRQKTFFIFLFSNWITSRPWCEEKKIKKERKRTEINEWNEAHQNKWTGHMIKGQGNPKKRINLLNWRKKWREAEKVREKNWCE